jgi:carboxymethylenebutenolidase
MGEFNTFMARDGHEFQAYLAAPAARPRGAIIVLQEIFGVNSHIRAVTDGFAAAGYTAIAPAFFDRVRRGIQLGYSPPEIQEGRGYMQQLKQEETLKDLAAAQAVVKNSGKTCTVGFCWGGAISYKAACDLPIAGAVVYYGNATRFLDKKPRCPVLYHFGKEDTSIPLSDVEKIQAAHPEGEFHLYEAGHGFNCDQRPSFNAEAAALARKRTLDFLAARVSGRKVEDDES